MNGQSWQLGMPGTPPWWMQNGSQGLTVKHFRGIGSLAVLSPLFHDT
ncbi:hypothetical protein [Oscillatoria sp. CS-180]|nr:hypothetical protein [Oscillatoria sp. CS-180]